jgi:hypothetical protein
MNGAKQIGVAKRRLSFGAISETFGFATPARFASELAIIVALCLSAAAWGLFLFSQFEFERLCRAFDFWFDSDPARTVGDINERRVLFHERSNLHPLYSILVAGPFGALGSVFGLTNETVTALYVALQSALLAGASYIAMRAFGLARVDAGLGIALLFSTSACLYWVGFPEWVAFGATSVIVCAAWVAGPPRMRNHPTGVAQNLASVSIVVTSWAIGLAASLVSDWPKLRWRQAFKHTRDALALLAALSVVQLFLFPEAGRFLDIWNEIDHNIATAQRSIQDFPIQFFGQTLVAPEMAVIEGARVEPSWGVPIITSRLQGVAFDPLTIVIFALWATLGAFGLIAGFRGGVTRPVFVIVTGTLAYFGVLHAVFGGEVFLFSLQFAPFMVFIALWSVQSRFKVAARVLCVALIALSATYNFPAFRSAVTIHNAIDPSWLDRDANVSREAARICAAGSGSRPPP